MTKVVSYDHKNRDSDSVNLILFKWAESRPGASCVDVLHLIQIEKYWLQMIDLKLMLYQCYRPLTYAVLKNDLRTKKCA